MRLAYTALVQAIVPGLSLVQWIPGITRAAAYCFDSPRKRPQQAALARSMLTIPKA